MNDRTLTFLFSCSQEGLCLYIYDTFILGNYGLTPRIEFSLDVPVAKLSREIRRARNGSILVGLAFREDTVTLLINRIRIVKEISRLAKDMHNLASGKNFIFCWAVPAGVFQGVISYKDPVRLEVGKEYLTRRGAKVMIYNADDNRFCGVFVCDGSTGTWLDNGHFNESDDMPGYSEGQYDLTVECKTSDLPAYLSMATTVSSRYRTRLRQRTSIA